MLPQPFGGGSYGGWRAEAEVGGIKGHGLSVDRVRIGEDDGTCNLLVELRSCEVGGRGCDTW